MAAAKQFTSTTKESSVHEPSTAPPANAHPSRLATNPQPNPAAMGNATKSQSASETSNQPKASHDTSSNKRPTSKSSGNGTHADPVSNHSVPAVTKDRPLTEVIKLGALLLDAMLETHAWAAARPKFESQLAVQKLENKISDVIDVESTQGMFQSSSRAYYSLSFWPSLLFGRAFALPAFSLLALSSYNNLLTIYVERTRQNLSEFVIKMKSALAALTGF
ncbi:hypothetical protein J3R30DRAFT_3693771 [Lentinula aciculospora]|uniref:Uncharacterized protein n=1 Tax=Lentinula aciculospora TaxID=153920 RepID=A0A9W9ATJ4_9AGAR|nr:hypothetical protein J3R30DRAFT_3693771 [Lentinula aciculospora]